MFNFLYKTKNFMEWKLKDEYCVMFNFVSLILKNAILFKKCTLVENESKHVLLNM